MRSIEVAGAAWISTGLLLTMFADIGRAQVDVAHDPAVAERPVAAPAGSEAPMAEDEKQRAATAAVYLAVGVAFVGILLIALVLIWGIRVRRLARRRVPSQSLPDPLWYLRTRTHGHVQEPPREERRDAGHE